MYDCLTIFIIYKNSEEWVVKRWVIDQDGAQPDLMMATADSLALARAMIPNGLIRFTRNKDDEENVFESWL
jgi:hypothetical protein